MLTDCGIISLDAHAILARVRLTVKATTLKTPLRTLLLPSTIPSHSNSWFWTRRSRSLIRFVHPNMSLFHFNIPISTNGLFHNPISTNPPITSSNINRSIQTPNPYTPASPLHPLLSPLPQPSAEIRRQRSKYAFERTFQVWGKSKLACSYVQANHASSAKFLRSPALSTGQAIGASLLSLARCGGLWDYPRALKAGLLHPTATDPDQLGSPSDTRFEPPISVAHSEIPRQAQDTVEENPTGSRTTTTDTHTAAISSTPTPTHISHIGSDDILTVLLGGSLPGTNTAGNTEACPGQQWLTGTVEEGNLLSSNQPVAHRMCDFLQISVRVYRAMLWKHHKSNLSHIPDI
ncbi:hypothetical protein BASA62_006802 [Batrachochytrium salamandrivorans]|nr:hypothetical protein BASA62_006802 [Batrachochytrium salamandrivorans]